MLDIKLIRENPDAVRRGLVRRGEENCVDELLALDRKRRELIVRTEELQRERNELSRAIGGARQKGGGAEDIQEKSRRVGEEAKALDGLLKEAQELIRNRLLAVPNLPHDSVPDGEDESANVEVRRWGVIPSFSFEPKSHVELGEKLGILDFSRAAKLAGARFALYMGAGAAMERALINFMLDIHTREHGYTEVVPPYMVNTETMVGTGQLPKFAGDLFKVDDTDYWLIPTAEAPLTNIHAGEILDGSLLPLSLTAYTPCFRSEAGSYGRDTIGLIRQHQFNKVELVKLTTPEDAEEELESLTHHAEAILRRLNLPYRVVSLCAGDLGFSASKTFDIEVWVPSQQKHREISSCSWFTDYQARRMNTRLRRGKKGKPEFIHTINGSGLAVGRTVVAILENHQRADGSVEIPAALRPYMNGLEAIA